MHTIVAFSEEQDPAGVFVAQAGVPDQHVKVVGDGIYISDFNLLLGAFACAGATATQLRLVSPSLRRINPFYITPLELALYPAGDPIHAVWPSIAVPLEPNEALESWINSDPAAGEQASTIIFLAQGAITPVAGRIITVRFEATLALVQGAWAFAEIDFVDELPVGTYDVVGGVMIVDTAVAFRFVPVGASHRPGAPVVVDEDNSAKIFRHGRFGTWFTFSTVQPPGIEILSSAAAGSAKYQGYMDVLPR